MVDFWVYDVCLLILFSLAVVVFLRHKKKQTKREGIMFLYRTKVGVKFINWFGGRFSKILGRFKYIIIGIGFILMTGILWLIGQSLFLYIKFPQIVEVIKAPPIAPLIPYFPKLFGLSSFFPPFYFIYFIVALLIVAVVHEFAHGVYMKKFGVKIKATGFAFLGPFLGAFVEQDDKQMKQKKNTEQMVILGAGVFANIIFALIFFGLMVGWFFLSMAPGGFIFEDYSSSVIPINNITGINYVENNFTKINVNNKTYFSNKILNESIKNNLITNGVEFIHVWDDTPALRVRLRGVIAQVNDIKILDRNDLMECLKNKKPGEIVNIKTILDEKQMIYEVELANHPLNSSIGYLGIVSSVSNGQGIMQKLTLFLMSFKNPSTYYVPKWDGEFVIFVYNLFWWIALINILVALFNMLPLGILDGGRFLYLAVLSLTQSKKATKIIYKTISYLILITFFAIMFFWAIRVF